MITDTVLQAIPREDRGKNSARRLRADGRVPVAIYGEGLDAVAASVNARDLGALLRSDAGRHAIFTLAVDGADSSPVKIHQMDIDPVTSRVYHLDLMRISLTSTTRVSVPLEFVGEPVGVKEGGGILDAHLHAVDIECLPRDIPSNISVDVSGLGVGDHLYVSQLEVDTDAVTILTDGEHLVVSVAAPRVSEEPAEEEEAVPAAEPTGTEAAAE